MTKADPRIAAALAAIASGNFADALASVETHLAGNPADLAGLSLGALCASRLGQSQRAIELLRRHFALASEDRGVRYNLAIALFRAGAIDEARAIAGQHADHARLARLAAYLHQQAGDMGAAVTSYRVALAGNPSDWESWNNLANCCHALGNQAEAIDAFERAINTHPDGAPAEIFLNLIRGLTGAENRLRRLTTTREALRRFPHNAQIRLEHGLALAAIGDMDGAEQQLEAAVAAGDPLGEAQIELALLYEHLNRLDDLDALVDSMATGQPSGELDFLEALRLRRQGRFAEARVHADRIPETINPVRSFQLKGEIADRLGETARAFEFYLKMNAASVAEHPAPPGQTYRERVEEATVAMRLPPPLSGPLAETAEPDPIFIVGSPRSGTTLLDTLLGSLPELHVTEELPMLAQIEAEFDGLEGASDPDLIDQARKRYRELAIKYGGDPAGKRLVDKMPLHMVRMPLIIRMFPKAKVILVERHPADAVLSCFMANFTLNHAMRSYADLDEAARTYAEIFTSWRKATELLEFDRTTVRYERMVSDLESEMRALLGFLDLPWRDSVLDNRAAASERGHVRTASYAQIGQPLYSRAVGRWERYADHLAPIMPILQSWTEWLGYGPENE